MLLPRIGFVTLLASLIFYSNINPQDRPSDLKNLKNIHSMISRWKASGFKGLYGDTILDSIGKCGVSKPDLKKMYVNARNRFQSQLSYLRDAEKVRESVTMTSEMFLDYYTNSLNFHSKYYKTYHTISGAVMKVDRDYAGNAYLLFDPGVKCVFPDYYAGELENIGIGETPTVKGFLTRVINNGGCPGIRD